MSEFFRGAKAKIKWANKRINELQGMLTDFLDSDFYHLSIDQDPEDGTHLLSFEPEPIPEDIALLLGDCIHNLRASLDLMYVELVRLVGGSVTRYTKFPFLDSRKNVKGALRQAKIHTSSPEVIDVILDTVKPYKGGNDPLLALHQLDIADKHHLLLPVIGVTHLRHVSGRDANNNVFTDLSFSVAGNHKLNAIRSSAEIEITNHGEPAFQIMFGEDNPLEGEPIFPTLQQLAQLVAGVVEAVEDAYVSTGK